MSRATEDQAFICQNCGSEVPRHPSGSYRNHCPSCLWSLHVDVVPGDRASQCHGPMRPVGVDHSGKKGFILLHACTRCGHVDRNKVASDDSLDELIAVQRPV